MTSISDVMDGVERNSVGEPDWAEINRVEREQEAAFAAGLSISERLELGQRLSDEAFELINGFRIGGDGPRRDPRA